MAEAYRFIDSSGQEHALADFAAVIRALRTGELRRDVMLYDPQQARWAIADQHPALRAVLEFVDVTAMSTATPDGDHTVSVPSAVSRTDERGIPQLVAAHDEAGLITAPSDELRASDANDLDETAVSALSSLEEDMARARARGLSSDSLRATYVAEKARILDEAAVRAGRRSQPVVAKRGANSHAMSGYTSEELFSGARWWARVLDLIGWTIVVVLILAVLAPHLELSRVTWTILPGFTWIPVEAWFVSRFGQSPAKAMLGLRIVSEVGGRITYGTALRRSVMVWIRGSGCNIPFVAVITALVARHRLKTLGRTAWDEELGLQVRSTH